MKQWYYVKNGERFGPVQKSQLLEFYQKGELNPTDLVWEEGTPDWITAEQALGPQPSSNTPIPPPEPYRVPPIQQKFEIISCIQKGWDMVWKYPLYLILGCFIITALGGIVQIPLQIGVRIWSIDPNPSLESPWVWASIIISSIGLVLSAIILPLLYAGLYWMILKIIRGQTPDLTDLFVAFKNSRLAIDLILLQLAVKSLVLLGSLLCLFPGVYLSVAYSFVLIIMVDRKLGIWETMELSRRVITKHWWPVFGLFILFFGINLLGLLACCVGQIIATPICVAAMLYAYEALFSGEPNN